MGSNNPINANEVKSIAEILLRWINANCTCLPNGKKLAYQYLGDDSSNMYLSFHTLKGTIKREEYVDGGYQGYFPFAIYLRDSPDSTSTRLDCDEVIDSIGSWISEQEDYPSLGKNINIESLSQVTNSTLVKRFNNGVEDHFATFELIYEKE